ncbi:unnamed protein product, partial [Tilletia caries]
MGAGGWSLGLERGTPTRGIGSARGGAALDLVFCSPALKRLGWVQECRTRQEFATGADHEVVWTALQADRGEAASPDRRLCEHRTDEEALVQELESMRNDFAPAAACALDKALRDDHNAAEELDQAMTTWH